MEIKEPKFNRGDKVIDEYGNIYIVLEISSYSFIHNDYWYGVENDVEKRVMLESKLELYQEPPKTVWELQKGDTYYVIGGNGEVMNAIWANIYIDKDCRKNGNVFLTEEEAENEVELRKIEAEMLRLGGRRNFKKGEDNYVIYYAYDDDGLNIVSYKFHFYQGEIYFDSYKKADDAIKTIGEDRIKKYIFGVES